MMNKRNETTQHASQGKGKRLEVRTRDALSALYPLTSTLKFVLVSTALLLVSCSDHSNVVDPGTDESIAGWFRSTTDTSGEANSSGSEVSAASSGSSQDVSSGTGASCSSSTQSQSGSSSSTQVVPSSNSVVSSSSNTASGQVIYNTQTCSYATGTPYGKLVCKEKNYKTVTISSASSSITLMAENLDIGTRVDGTASDANQANDALIEKYCYGDTEANCTTDGGLYQWCEAMGQSYPCNSAVIATGHHRGICPVGWHIPKPAEWNTLATLLGGSDLAGKKMKLNTAGYSSWDAVTYNDGNSSYFSALPAGVRAYGGGFGSSRGTSAMFWEASESSAAYANDRYLLNNSEKLIAESHEKTRGFSVRCFKD